MLKADDKEDEIAANDCSNDIVMVGTVATYWSTVTKLL